MEFRSRDIWHDSRALIGRDCIEKAQQGSERDLNHIFQVYRPIVYIKSNKYFLPGGEVEDLAQEGFIGLYKAVADYRFDKGTSFKTFAELCIRRSILNSIKAANRYKHIPLNEAKSLEYHYGDEEGRTLLDLIHEKREDYSVESTNPESIFFERENCRVLLELVDNQLTQLEREVLRLYIAGNTYLEIADLLGKNKKSVDNALRRIKKKSKRYLKLYY